MDTLRVFWLFINKQWMALRYHWKSFSMLLAGCLGLQLMMLHFAYVPIEPLRVEQSAENIEELVTGCLFQMDPPYSGTFYSPNSSQVNQVMEHICGPEVFDQGFHQLSLMIKYLQACKEECYGVHFHINADDVSNDVEGNSTSSIMTYTIYTNHMKLDTKQRYITDSLHLSFTQSHSYRKFLKLQHSIDVALVELQHGNREDVVVSIGAMPSIRGGFYHNEVGMQTGGMVALFLIVILVITFIVPLVEEKEDGLKEFLIITTPLAYLNGLAFYVVHYLLYLLYGGLIMTFSILYQCLGIVPVIHGVILYVLFLTAMMSYSYLLSVCFQKVFYAKTCGFLLHFLPSIVFELFPISKYLFSLNTFIEAWVLTQIISNKYGTFKWNDIFKIIVDDKMSLGTAYIFLLIQSFVYLLLYYYFESIFPGPGGIKQSYLFFLKKEFWKKRTINDRHYRHTTECVEDTSTNAIVIENLKKEFNILPERKIIIADNLNMKINNKEITVLLGHNGAGKTTIINMIMGLIDQDDGEITVCSEGNVSIYRHSIGYCPQHSIYMQYMTCRQHLIFFARLRGLNVNKAKILANKLLDQLQLSNKASEYGKHLSGGMKRRLSLGMAIAGKTKVVILDEPSSGLDIESRRELWDVLLELRKTKAILITTHHMEEAEVLGDTINILANGQLQMTGSPLELKRKVGSGYILKLCVNQNQFNLDNCLEEIHQFVPSARLTNALPATVSISLPYEHRQSYHLLLSHLENHQQQLAITTISITDTTLEDVFLNSAGAKDEVDALEIDQVDVPYQRIDIQYEINSWQQFKAISYKKIVFIINNYWLTILMFLLPFIFTTLAILAIHSSAFKVFGEGLDLKLNHYEKGIVYISKYNENLNPRIKMMTELLKEQINMQQKSIEIIDLEINPGENIEKELMYIMQDDIFAFQQNVIGCIHIDNDSITKSGQMRVILHYSMNMLHSSAILLNVIDNTIKEWSSEKEQPTPIHTIYAPLAINDSSADSLNLIYYATLTTAGVFMLMLYFIVLPFRENCNGFKRLQPISSSALWCNSLFCDLFLLLVICLMLFGYQLIIMPSYLYDVDNLLQIMLAVYFYGFTYLPLIYSFSSAFTSLSVLSSIMILIFFLSVVPSFILSSTVGDMLRYEKYIFFLRLLPDFNLIHQLRIINEQFVNDHIPDIPEHIRTMLNSKTVLNLGTFYVYVLFVFSLLMVILLMFIENRSRREKVMELLRCKRRINKSQQCPTPNKEEDQLVQEERRKVEKIIRDGDEGEHPLVVHNLYKYYRPTPAVSGISFAVHKKECFGLLGVNGAGKTTTFEMIAANNTISAGNIQIEGIDQQLKRKQYRYQFGYCPQEDCLNDFMTSYQTLKFMALLRGITTMDSNSSNGGKNILEAEINYWLARLDLTKYKYVQVRHYSGGTKRKLQTATAMIGSPWLVLLDEPTTGVDPISRRFLWQSMQNFQKRNRTIVLTSHSMDECEYLCNRLAIMADGQFKCLGHVPELKQMYGSGFTINVQLHPSIVSDINDAVISTISDHLREHFQDCLLRENHAGILTYFIRTSQNNLRWSQIFEKAEIFLREVEDLVEEYSINETTLEDIFLRYYNKSANGSFSIQISD